MGLPMVIVNVVVALSSLSRGDDGENGQIDHFSLNSNQASEVWRRNNKRKAWE